MFRQQNTSMAIGKQFHSVALMDYQIECMVPGFEPLMVEKGEVMALSDIVEDELLLMLPMAPMHPEGICSISRE